MNPTAVIVGLIAFTFLCYRGVDAQVNQCYQCTSPCDNPVVENCTNTETMSYNCWSQDYTDANGNPVIVKGCVLDSPVNTAYCATLTAAGGTCNICNTELCNSSSIMYSFSLILLISVFMLSRLS